MIVKASSVFALSNTEARFVKGGAIKLLTMHQQRIAFELFRALRKEGCLVEDENETENMTTYYYTLYALTREDLKLIKGNVPEDVWARLSGTAREPQGE